MVKRCCVKGCGNESFSGCNISFHSFPKDEEMKQRWLLMIPVNLGKHTVVCSRHFKPPDFTISCSRNFLVPTAVPSIFPVPNEKKIIDIILAQPDSTAAGTAQDNLDEPTLNLNAAGEPPTKMLCSADRSCVAVQTAQTMSSSTTEESLRRKAKILSQRLKRRETKIENLKELLNLLENKCRNFDEVNDL